MCLLLYVIVHIVEYCSDISTVAVVIRLPVVTSRCCVFIGMSTAPEVVVATHCGLRVFGLSLITNKVNTQHRHQSTHDGSIDGL